MRSLQARSLSARTVRRWQREAAQIHQVPRLHQRLLLRRRLREHQAAVEQQGAKRAPSGYSASRERPPVAAWCGGSRTHGVASCKDRAVSPRFRELPREFRSAGQFSPVRFGMRTQGAAPARRVYSGQFSGESARTGYGGYKTSEWPTDSYRFSCSARPRATRRGGCSNHATSGGPPLPIECTARFWPPPEPCVIWRGSPSAFSAPPPSCSPTATTPRRWLARSVSRPAVSRSYTLD